MCHFRSNDEGGFYGRGCLNRSRARVAVNANWLALAEAEMLAWTPVQVRA